jgi:hypothetical protein
MSELAMMRQLRVLRGVFADDQLIRFSMLASDRGATHAMRE